MKNINTRLQEMTNKLSSKELFESNGLGNEINFHVFDYDPEDEYIVRDYLDNYLLKKTKLNIKVFDIYEIIIEILKEKGFLEKCFDYEKKKGAKYLNQIISKTIGIGSSNDLIMKKIKSDKTKKKNNKLIKWFKKKLKSKKLQFNLGETIIFMLITFSFGLVLGGVVMYGKGFFGHHTTSTMNEFISTYSDIVNNYYEDVNEDELLEAGINGMLRKLGDPYTVFMSKNQADDFNESVEGIYHGIGAQIKYDDKFEHVLIGEVFENSPAEQAGLMTDDELIKVNGESIEKMSFS